MTPPQSPSSLIGCLDAAAARRALSPLAAGGHAARRRLRQAIDALPVAPPKIDDTLGKRETHNRTRLFFGAEIARAIPVCDDLAAALQSAATSSSASNASASTLREEPSAHRILPRHRRLLARAAHRHRRQAVHDADLSLGDPGCEAWGTDILDADLKLVDDRALPAQWRPHLRSRRDTWHGFRSRPIDGVRRSLIVNYVKPEWRSRHELAFPDRLAGA